MRDICSCIADPFASIADGNCPVVVGEMTILPHFASVLARSALEKFDSTRNLLIKTTVVGLFDDFKFISHRNSIQTCSGFLFCTTEPTVEQSAIFLFSSTSQLLI